MKNLKIIHFFIVTVLGIMIYACTKDSSNSSEDLTKTIIGNYQCPSTIGTTIITGIPTVITKENNNTIKIAITGKDTVTAIIIQMATTFIINVQDQTGITDGYGGDFVNNAINFGFKKTTNGTTVQVNYYGIKSL